jgi:hypothetical protein
MNWYAICVIHSVEENLAQARKQRTKFQELSSE